MNKRGVSLVTVLLFMMVATIAATATYRWITSENNSSASRMMEKEALQASNAGIKMARGWMTMNANDVGGLIRQFLSSENAKKPILLNSRFDKEEIQEDGVVKKSPLGGENQKYSVWLVGADTKGTAYNLKIASVGEARNGSKHTEIAVFQVEGLYQVGLPVKTSAVDFNYSYFGGSLASNKSALTSAVVNGDLTMSEPQNLSGDLIVTGSLDATKGTATLAKATCVGGDFSGTSKLTINDIYVAGTYSFTNESYIDGNAYFNNVDIKSRYSSFDVNGSVSLAGKMAWKPFSAEDYKKTVNVKKDLCLTEEAVLEFDLNKTGSESENLSFNVYGDVYIPQASALQPTVNDGTRRYMKKNDDALVWGNGYENNYTRIRFGLTEKSDLYIEGLENFASYTWAYLENGVVTSLGKCGYDDWNCIGLKSNQTLFNEKNNVYSSLFNVALTKSTHLKSVPYSKPIACADEVKSHCLSIMKKAGEGKVGCDESQFIVEDPIVTAYGTFNTYATKGCAANITKYDDNLKDNVKNCYDNMKNNVGTESSASLYNDFLVVKVSSSEKAPGSIDRKTILIFEEKAEIKLAPTTDMAVLYFKQGAKINMEGVEDANYFIYSEGPIETTGNGSIKGSIFTPQSACVTANIPNITVDFDGELISALAESSIICKNDGSGCGGSSSLPSEIAGETTNGFDSYYTTMSPQLVVNLVSQYENNEMDVANLDKDDYSEVKPSTLVLPRVVYMTQDPYGSLSDYYKMFGLNGAKTPTKVTESCMGSSSVLHTNGRRLYDPKSGDDLIPEGIYRCTMKDESSDEYSYEAVPLYIVVKGLNATTPKVSYESESIELLPGEGRNAVVRLSIQNGEERSEPYSIDVVPDEIPSGWSVSVVPGASITEGYDDDGRKKYTVHLSPKDKLVDVLVVSAVGVPDRKFITFRLQNEDGCVPSAPTVCQVYLDGQVVVNRQGISEYCAISGKTCSEDTLAFAKRPDCSEGLIGNNIWVRAVGRNCIANETNPNDKWSCKNVGSIRLAKGITLDQCEAMIADTSIFAPEEDGSPYTLYASIKKKSYKLTLHVVATASNPTVYVREISDLNNTEERGRCTKGNSPCIIDVFAGDYLEFSYNKNSSNINFSRWVIEFKGIKDGYSTDEFVHTVGSNLAVTAYFDQVDGHCFYEDFTENPVCDSDRLHCIDICKATLDKGEGCNIKDGKYNNSMWLAIYNNDVNKKNFDQNSVKWDESGDYVYSENTKQADNQNGNQAFILNKRLAGANGVLEAQFQTNVFAKKGEPYLNTGFILRSNENGSEYFSLMIYGVGVGDCSENYCEDKLKTCKDDCDSRYSSWIAAALKEACRVKCDAAYAICKVDCAAESAISQGHLVARLCYGTHQGIENTNKGNCKEKDILKEKDGGHFIISGVGAGVGIENMLTMEATLDGDHLSIGVFGDKAIHPDGRASAEFDFSEVHDDPLLNNQYVGYKLSNKDFYLNSISWATTSFGEDEECFDVPKLECSMAAPYLGGIVPKDSNVSPWVGTNKKLRDLGCENLEYFYNGCDIPSDYAGHDRSLILKTPQAEITGVNTYNVYHSSWCINQQFLDVLQDANLASDEKSWEPFWLAGWKLNDNKLYFKREGDHGISKTQRKGLKDYTGIYRDVFVRCRQADVGYRVAHCGQFYVGEYKVCSENIDMFERSIENSGYIAAESNFTIDYGSPINLRDANLIVKISGKVMDDDEVSVTLIDENDNDATSNAIKSNGENYIGVSGFTNKTGFNPEKIKRVIVRGTGNFVLESLKSSCPYAVTISGCTAEYNKQVHKWYIKNSIENISGTTKCRIYSTSTSATFEGTCQNKQYEIEEKNYSNMDGMAYGFTIDVYTAGGKIVSCNTEPVTITEEESSSSEARSSSDGTSTSEAATSSITVVEESSSSATLDEMVLECADISGKQDVGTAIDYTPKMVGGCNENGCKYDLQMGGATLVSSDGFSYSGGSISFTEHSNSCANSSCNYTLNLTRTDGATSSCNFKVSYNDKVKGDCEFVLNGNKVTDVQIGTEKLHIKMTGVKNTGRYSDFKVQFNGSTYDMDLVVIFDRYESDYITAPLQAGRYDAKVTLSGKEVCSVTLNATAVTASGCTFRQKNKVITNMEVNASDISFRVSGIPKLGTVLKLHFNDRIYELTYNNNEGVYSGSVSQVPSSSGNFEWYVKYDKQEQNVCEGTLPVSPKPITGKCSFTCEKNVWGKCKKNKTAEFKVSNVNNLKSEAILSLLIDNSIKTMECSSNECTVSLTLPNSKGTYGFRVSASNQEKEVCSGSVEIGNN